MKQMRFSSKYFFVLTLIAIASVLSSFDCNIEDQSLVKDFFIPNLKEYNKAIYTPIVNGEKSSDRARMIGYKNNNDGTFQLLDVQVYQGEILSVTKKTIKFTKNSVLLLKSGTASVLKGGHQNKVYSNPIVLLKMPLEGQSISWTVVDGDTKNLTASWTSIVDIYGERKKAIKVVSSFFYKKAKISNIYYYVQGMGLMNTELRAYGEQQLSETLESLTFE